MKIRRSEVGGRKSEGRRPMEERRPLCWDEGRKGKKVRRLEDKKVGCKRNKFGEVHLKEAENLSGLEF